MKRNWGIISQFLGSVKKKSWRNPPRGRSKHKTIDAQKPAQKRKFRAVPVIYGPPLNLGFEPWMQQQLLNSIFGQMTTKRKLLIASIYISQAAENQWFIKQFLKIGFCPAFLGRISLCHHLWSLEALKKLDGDFPCKQLLQRRRIYHKNLSSSGPEPKQPILIQFNAKV